tara:strand:- start:365 stop:475 length:111 start_codon:yes stop_codon:yes gene_type:complete
MDIISKNQGYVALKAITHIFFIAVGLSTTSSMNALI